MDSKQSKHFPLTFESIGDLVTLVKGVRAEIELNPH